MPAPIRKLPSSLLLAPLEGVYQRELLVNKEKFLTGQAAGLSNGAKGDDTMVSDTRGRISEASEFRPWFKHYDPEVPLHLTYPHIPLYSLLDETAAKHPGSPCTNFFSRRLTYQQIKELSDRFGASIRSLGIRKGDRVVLLLPNSP